MHGTSHSYSSRAAAASVTFEIMPALSMKAAIAATATSSKRNHCSYAANIATYRVQPLQRPVIRKGIQLTPLSADWPGLNNRCEGAQPFDWGVAHLTQCATGPSGTELRLRCQSSCSVGEKRKHG